MIWAFLRPLVWCEYRYYGDGFGSQGDGDGYGEGDTYGRGHGDLDDNMT